MRSESMKAHTVLLVDDEPNVVEGLMVGLRREAYRVVTANSGADGLELMSRVAVDVVVSDEQMPGMQGSEFLAKVRELYPNTTRIILTGQASLQSAIRAINEGGVYRFLTKPCNPTDLAHTIRQALQLRDLSLQSARLLDTARRQHAVLEELELEHPGIGNVDIESDGTITLSDVGDVESLMGEITAEMKRFDLSQ